MRLIIIFLIVIFALAVLANLGQLLDEGLFGEIFSQEEAQEEQVSPESSRLASIVKPRTSPSLINTYITAGPEEGGIVEETNRVTFEFGSETKKGVFFETKVEGLDNDWVKTSSPKRTIILPLGQTEYAFLVRAKTNNSIDSTPAKRTFKVNISPYFGQVRISSVRAPNSSFPSVITLRAQLSQEEEINLTGWQVEGKRGKTTIPKGIEKYFPGLSPKDDIIVKSGNTVQLTSGQSPLRKKISFRSNKCFGYLSGSNDSSFSLPRSCLTPGKEEISHLNPCCQGFILQNRGCEVPDYSWNSKIYQDSECVSYLEKNFSYSSCFRKHVGDKDFLSSNWLVFLSFDVATGDFCDTIYLRDKDGFFVDKYSYGRDVCR